jgi:molybdenum cofactor cytidylyltransferase
VPAIFPLNTFDDLLKLKGDKGARTYLNNENENVIKFTPKSSEILSDIDTPEDYKKFITNKNS